MAATSQEDHDRGSADDGPEGR